MAAHRTWIEPNADGYLWRKARLAEPKKVLGAFEGGYIPLWKGEHAVPLHRLPAGVPIAVSEGIEDGLTVACACPELRVIAAISLANIANIPLPPNGRDGRPGNPVTIIAQNDPPGSQAAKALERVVMKLIERGAQVAVARPPQGVKDANDLANAGEEERRTA
nr:toprim domain-containing protein [Sphingomonas oligoaromativorans]